MEKQLCNASRFSPDRPLAYLSGILLVGRILNAAFAWWWADPVAALVMVPIIAKEGIEALQGKACDDCHS